MLSPAFSASVAFTAEGEKGGNDVLSALFIKNGGYDI